MKQYYRRLDKDTLDYHPTPPWATRALFKYVLKDGVTSNSTCLEPACGEYHMSKVLEEYFKEVSAKDIVDGMDFLKVGYDPYDWIITNPPFSLASEFILKALDVAKDGVAMLARLQLLEGQRRYENIFSKHPPRYVCPFTERVSMVKGKVVRKSGSTMAMAWFVWNKHDSHVSRLSFIPKVVWIPPCQKELEKDEDYVETLSRTYFT